MKNKTCLWVEALDEKRYKYQQHWQDKPWRVRTVDDQGLSMRQDGHIDSLSPEVVYLEVIQGRQMMSENRLSTVDVEGAPT